MATQSWLSLRFTALGAAGHGTAVEGVSDRVEANIGRVAQAARPTFPDEPRNAVSDVPDAARRLTEASGVIPDVPLRGLGIGGYTRDGDAGPGSRWESDTVLDT